MAEHIEPVDPSYRLWAAGAQLAEFHALTGAWSEFEVLVGSDASIARDILVWVIPEADPDAVAYGRAKAFARLSLQSLD